MCKCSTEKKNLQHFIIPKKPRVSISLNTNSFLRETNVIPSILQFELDFSFVTNLKCYKLFLTLLKPTEFPKIW